MPAVIAVSKLGDAQQESAGHVGHLFGAMHDLASLFPMTAERVEHLSMAGTRTLDQFVFRFSKLQDAVGNRLFPAILEVLAEPYADWSWTV